MNRFSNNPTGSATTEGAAGSSLYYFGRFYDNVYVQRKGVTALTYPKPK